MFIDKRMAENNELTARQLQRPNLSVSLHVHVCTIKKAHKRLGSVATQPKYSQLHVVCPANRVKWVAWCEKCLSDKEKFSDVIWTDECTVQIDSHACLCYRGRNLGNWNLVLSTHAVEVYIWGGIFKPHFHVMKKSWIDSHVWLEILCTLCGEL